MVKITENSSVLAIDYVLTLKIAVLFFCFNINYFLSGIA